MDYYYAFLNLRFNSLGGHAMRKSRLSASLFIIFVAVGIVGIVWSGMENISLSIFTGLVMYVLMVLVPVRFLGLDFEQKGLWVMWITLSLAFAILWFKISNDKTTFLYVTAGVLFWIVLGLISIKGSSTGAKWDVL